MAGAANVNANVLQSIRKFDGTEDAEAWVSHIEDVRTFLNWTQAQMVAAARLRFDGAAQQWWLALPLAERLSITTIAALRAALLARFPIKDEYTLWQQFTNLQCSAGDAVSAYTDEFRRMADRLRINDDMTLLQCYVRGLPKRVKTQVVREQPATLVRAIAAALREERVHEYLDAQRNASALPYEPRGAPLPAVRAAAPNAAAPRLPAAARDNNPRGPRPPMGSNPPRGDTGRAPPPAPRAGEGNPAMQRQVDELSRMMQRMTVQLAELSRGQGGGSRDVRYVEIEESADPTVFYAGEAEAYATGTTRGGAAAPLPAPAAGGVRKLAHRRPAGLVPFDLPPPAQRAAMAGGGPGQAPGAAGSRPLAPLAAPRPAPPPPPRTPYPTPERGVDNPAPRRSEQVADDLLRKLKVSLPLGEYAALPSGEVARRLADRLVSPASAPRRPQPSGPAAAAGGPSRMEINAVGLDPVYPPAFTYAADTNLGSSSSSAAPRFHSAMAPIKVGDRELVAVVDTGASTTVFSKALVLKLGLWKMVEAAPVSLVTASGQRVRASGVLRNLPISMQDTTIKVDVYVSEANTYDALLGMDWLVPAGCVIDLQSREISIPHRLQPDTWLSQPLSVGEGFATFYSNYVAREPLVAALRGRPPLRAMRARAMALARGAARRHAAEDENAAVPALQDSPSEYGSSDDDSCPSLISGDSDCGSSSCPSLGPDSDDDSSSLLGSDSEEDSDEDDLPPLVSDSEGAPEQLGAGLDLVAGLAALHVAAGPPFPLGAALDTEGDKENVPPGGTVGVAAPATAEIAEEEEDPLLARGAPLGVADLYEQFKLEGKAFNIAPDLEGAERRQVLEVLEGHVDVFSFTKKDFLRSNMQVQHKVDTGDATPIAQRAYRLSPMQRDAVDAELDKLLELGLIRPSSSAWASPIVMVPKKDGSWRMCIDYRKVNAATKNDQYPLPVIEDLLTSMGQAQYFTTLDLRSGYWQIPMDPASVEKTAFISHRGLYEFTYMPFGLKSAPATFQRYMNSVLHGLAGKLCHVYLDDIVIFSPTLAEHLEHIDQVLGRLHQFGLVIAVDKCTFAAGEISYLGHIVSRSGLQVDPQKIQAINDMPTPTNLQQLRSILGSAGYYRHFVRDYSKMVAPLTALSKKGAEWQWTETQQQALDGVKAALSSPPILAHPDYSRPFTVYSDFSKNGLGAILAQVGDDGRERVCAYASRRTTDTEAKYCSYKGELLAVLFAVEKFQPYLLGLPFRLVVDNHALAFLNKGKQHSATLARWALRLQEFTFDVVHRPGTSHANVDGLSRMYPEHPAAEGAPQEEEPQGTRAVALLNAAPAAGAVLALEQAAEREPEVFGVYMLRVEPQTGLVSADLACEECGQTADDANMVLCDHCNRGWHRQCASSEAQYRETWYEYWYCDACIDADMLDPSDPTQDLELLHYMRTGTYPEDMVDTRAKARVRMRARHFELGPPGPRGLLYHQGLPVPPYPQRFEIMRLAHTDMGHRSARPVTSVIRSHFWWPTLSKDVAAFIKNCAACRDRPKLPRAVRPLQPIPFANKLQRWGLDCGVISRSVSPRGFVLAVEYHTKWVEAVPLVGPPDSGVIARFFRDNILARYGPPLLVICDNGSEFSGEFDRLCAEHNVLKRPGAAYHPQGNGLAERMVQTVKDALAKATDGDASVWADKLPEVLYGIRTAAQASTKVAPYLSLFGEVPPLFKRESMAQDPAEADFAGSPPAVEAASAAVGASDAPPDDETVATGSADAAAGAEGGNPPAPALEDEDDGEGEEEMPADVVGHGSVQAVGSGLRDAMRGLATAIAAAAAAEGTSGGPPNLAAETLDPTTPAAPRAAGKRPAEQEAGAAMQEVKRRQQWNAALAKMMQSNSAKASAKQALDYARRNLNARPQGVTGLAPGALTPEERKARRAMAVRPEPPGTTIPPNPDAEAEALLQAALESPPGTTLPPGAPLPPGTTLIPGQPPLLEDDAAVVPEVEDPQVTWDAGIKKGDYVKVRDRRPKPLGPKVLGPFRVREAHKVWLELEDAGGRTWMAQRGDALLEWRPSAGVPPPGASTDQGWPEEDGEAGPSNVSGRGGAKA